MKRIYITEIKKRKMAYEGPKISALNWADAKKQAAIQGAVVIGELA
ncbi:MAG: hypothetical protein WC196_02790 [Bacilli bacterium]